MKKLIALILSLLPLCAASAQQLTPERQSAMLPFVARDRERAMNDVALCSGDLSIMQNKMADLQKQLADAKEQIDKLKTVSSGRDQTIPSTQNEETIKP